MTSTILNAFAGYGIELEYAIVDRVDLSCRPIADKLLGLAAGIPTADVSRGMFGWSNEMVTHVIEIKNRRPAPSLEYLSNAFQHEVHYINRLLQPYGAQLMPTAMHPWMDPQKETRIWEYDNAEIYQTYERLFDTRTHGWANLQSMHINLPFADDAQFEKLHAAIRVILPIIPALAASSPIADGCNSGYADYRMEVYRTNADAFPSIAGKIIPDTISNRREYEEKILAPMYRDIAPHDPGNILQQEWLNSRGAIARFDRNAIEIRVVDTQECPKADMAVAAAVIAAVKTLYDGKYASLEMQQSIDTDALSEIFLACIQDADRAIISNIDYLKLLGYPRGRCNARQLWRHLVSEMIHGDPLHTAPWREPLDVILEYGPLARRISRAANGDHTKPHLAGIYADLCVCLNKGKMFIDVAH